MRSLCEETERLLKPIKLGEFDKIEIGIFADLESFTVDAFQSYSPESPRKLATLEAIPNRWQWRIPGSRIDTKGKLICPATDFSVIVICALFPDDRITFRDQAAKTVFEYLCATFKSYFNRAQQQADFKTNSRLTALAESLPNPPWLTDENGVVTPMMLNKYQRCAASCATGAEGYALFMEQGTGKTAVVIARMDEEARRRKLQADKPIFKTLIVAPLNVRANWEAELKKFSTLRGKVFCEYGDWVGRQKLMLDAATVSKRDYDWSALVISYGVMQRDAKLLACIPWDLAVLDEGHYICNGKAQRTRAALIVRDAAKSRMLLTGTPMPNRIGELYSQLEFLGKGFSGFRSRTEFDKFYEVTQSFHTNGRDNLIVTGLQNTPILQERLARMSFIIKKKDALPDLPEKMYDVVGVQMTAEQRAVYKRAVESVMVEAEAELGGSRDDGRNYNMVLQNVLKKMLRLSQITSGFFVTDNVYDDVTDEILMAGEMHRFDPNPKIEELVELVKNKPKTSKTIIWCCWKQDIKSISARLRLEGLDYVSMHGETPQDERERIKKRFNEDVLCRGLVGGSASGGVGVNLLGHSDDDTNCDHVIYFSQNFSSPIRSQSEDRPHRLGTRVPVRYTDLVVPGTIDQEIREAVVLKRRKSYAVQDVRDILHKLAVGL